MANLRGVLLFAELEGLATREVVSVTLSDDESMPTPDEEIIREHEEEPGHPIEYGLNTYHGLHGVKDGWLFHWGNRPVSK